ncbi:hypothetical protein FJ872_32300 [Mesorhizobium sp. B2-5-9]|uniref:hypothetical protein n=1 Tax=Mesorhizobium sp. B2-5-9 TaxID=2589921 RepID=UPI00112EA5DC|nr:hypothetical protein [Mesorhizobium sp. B2-5-9]TPJ96773.1 hypothetical protein FJ872_32300 [Mesorhizobium sp. B2-5-9]
MTLRCINRRSVSRIVDPAIASPIADRFSHRRRRLNGNLHRKNTINWFMSLIGCSEHLINFRFMRDLENLGSVWRVRAGDMENTLPSALIKNNIDERLFPTLMANDYATIAKTSWKTKGNSVAEFLKGLTV